MNDQNAQNLTEKIALFLQENQTTDNAFLRSSLEKINQRLDAIESNQTAPKSSEIHHSPFTVHHSKHPSQEKFVNLAEFADENINDSTNEKACPFEPTGKPCDNCSMCNSRGF